jgi:hypothetical protein
VKLKGTFDLGASNFPGGASVVISNGTMIQGIEDVFGEKPMIKRGYFAFMVLSAEDVVIENLHFYDSGGVGLFIGRVGENARIEVRENEFTNSLWATFGDDQPPDEIKSQRLRFNSSLQMWFHHFILVYPSAGDLDAIKGDILIEKNVIDQEAEGLPKEMSLTFYGTVGIQSIGIASESSLTIQRNTIENCSWAGISMQDHIGSVLCSHNSVFLGNVGFYYNGGYPYSAYGIGAVYGFFNLYGLPAVGGDISIIDNKVVAKGTDAIGIRAHGLRLRDGTGIIQTYRAVSIEWNKVKLENYGYYGFSISGINEAEMIENKVKGEAILALMLGGDDPFGPILTEGNIISYIKLKSFTSLSGSDIFLHEGTSNNIIENISGDGAIVDNGYGNIIHF